MRTGDASSEAIVSVKKHQAGRNLPRSPEGMRRLRMTLVPLF